MFSTSTTCMTYQSKKKISRPGNTGEKQMCCIHTCTSASNPPPPGGRHTHTHTSRISRQVRHRIQIGAHIKSIGSEQTGAWLIFNFQLAPV